MPSKYVTVKLPRELIKAIDKVMEQGRKGYKSRGEFIKEAIRLRLEEVAGLKKPLGLRQKYRGCG